MMNNLEFTHRRRNPLTDQWVLVSPHRNNRPWQGATEPGDREPLPGHDPRCPLCPGNARANGERNPAYGGTHVFANDFGALMPSGEGKHAPVDNGHSLLRAETASGECRVVCFSPEHNKSLPELPLPALRQVVDTWQCHYLELSARYACVQIFENKGAVMGCSQPHPHGQIWAHDHLSTEVHQEQCNQYIYFQQHGRCLLADTIVEELRLDQRIVIDHPQWLVVVPFWAAWPFETLVIAREDVRHFGTLTETQKDALAAVLKELTIRYDNLFECSFPYSMGWHNAPADGQDDSHWRLHAHFYPPLLRSATIKKHMVGYEMLAESQRDLTPETAAALLRAVSTRHYKQGNGDDA